MNLQGLSLTVSIMVLILISSILIGCSGLKRTSYPVTVDQVISIGIVKHIQPYIGAASESNLSRAGWGFLAGGLFVGAIAGLADDNINSYKAYSMIIESNNDRVTMINSFSRANVGDCVVVYQSTGNNINSISILSKSRCESQQANR